MSGRDRNNREGMREPERIDKDRACKIVLG